MKKTITNSFLLTLILLIGFTTIQAKSIDIQKGKKYFKVATKGNLKIDDKKNVQIKSTVQIL